MPIIRYWFLMEIQGNSGGSSGVMQFPPDCSKAVTYTVEK
jgi:hypothetical protein